MKVLSFIDNGLSKAAVRALLTCRSGAGTVIREENGKILALPEFAVVHNSPNHGGFKIKSENKPLLILVLSLSLLFPPAHGFFV